MLILKMTGLLLIAAVIAFAALLIKGISELETEIKAEKIRIEQHEI